MHLELEAISKRFGPVPALVGVDLRVGDRELITLLGPSGSGKTTLLRIIAGLEFADGGTVRFDGEDVSGRPVGERQIGFVFQHYALFRHLTVSENVAFGLRVRPRSRRPPAAAIRHRVEELLTLMQLPGYGPRYPAQLSGGQRQRVAFARALATEPRMLLLDEPFGALDARVRRDLRRWLRGVQESLGLTTVMVTHDQDEALEVADRVVVMNAGRVEQVGTPQEVYDRPASPFVLEFLGGTNRLAWPLPGAADLSSSTGSGEEAGAGVGKATAYVRRHDVVIHRVPPAAADRAGAAVVPATVRRVHAAGPLARVELTRTDTGEFVEAELTRHEQEQTRFRAGEAVYLEFRVVLRPG